MNKKIILSISLILLLLIIIGINLYIKIFNPTVTKNAMIIIKSGSNIETLKKTLKPNIKNINDFLWLSKLKKFNVPKPGKYIIKKGMSLNNLINTLRSGNQTPVKVSFNNQDTLEKLASRISQQLEIDSLSLIKVMRDKLFLQKNNFSQNTALGMYIPDKYEFYWNSSAENFRDKMLKNFNKFWNKSRREKAKKLGLTINQVITLASIVQKETVKISERPIVAGLYLNRFNNNWPLQADPTIIFALKKKTVKIKYIKEF